jgi:hypothetical protein
MHKRMLVTTLRVRAETSEEARRYVFNYLQEEGFASMGRFGWGMCDWFVIGGRWSGFLAHRTSEMRGAFGSHIGAEDDAMIVTEKIYDEFLKTFENTCEERDYLSVEEENLNRAIIGKYWVVVVDYHS